MKFNKKLLSVFFIALFAIVLVGCDGDTTLPITLPTTTEDTTTEAPTTTEGETTEAPTTTEGETTTEEPTTEEPTTEEPTTEEPTTEEPTTEEPTLPVDIEAALDALIALYEDLEDDTYVVESDLNLRSDVFGYQVTWESSDPDYLTNDGVITRPLYSEGPETVFLTATLTYGSQTEEYTFFVTIAASDTKTPQEIATEVFLVATAFPNKTLWTSADELEFVAVGEDADGNEYDITWTTSHPEIITLDGYIIQPEGGNVDVTITASITVDEETVTKEMVFTVAELPELDGTVNTIAEALALGEDSYVKIVGATVEAVDENGSVYITDGTNIIFIYSPRYDVTVGETYDFYGLVDIYYNAPQLAGSDTHPLLAMASDATPVEQPLITANDVPEVIDEVHMPTADNNHVYKKFTVTAAVYYEEDWGNYSVFLVPTDYDFDAPLASGATQPNGNAIMMYYPANDEVLRGFHGQQVTIDIIMQGYRTDKNVFYAVFFGTTDDVDFYFETEQIGIDATFNALSFPKYILENETLELPATMFKDVALTYASSNDVIIDPATGEVDVTGVTYEVVTLTVTATYGATTDTMTVDIPVGVPAKADISAALASDNGFLFQVEGVVIAGGYYNTYFIQDATGNIALYTSDDDALALLEANVGNVVNVVGSRGAYNGLNQLRVETVTYVSDDTVPAATNIDAMTLDTAGLAAYQGQLVELTNMVIIDLYEDKYGNLEFTFERLSDGETIEMKWDSRFDLPSALETEVMALEIGDKVSFTTVLAWNNGPFLYLVSTMDLTVSELSDQDKVDLDARYMDTELTLTEDYELIGDFGSTITVLEVFGNISNYMDLTTTPGTVLIEQPIGADVMGTMTIRFTSGGISEDVEVHITLPGTELPIINELFISEYGEGSSNNKWLEIYNGTGATVDLSEYAVKYYNNGASVVTQTFVLSGMLEHGDVYLLTTNQAVSELQDIADEVFPYPSVVHYNGDDAIELVKGDMILDVIGIVGEDPGTNWPVGTGATSENTLVRNADVIAPNATFTEDEWDVYPQDTFTYAGSHTVNAPVLTDEQELGLDRALLDLDQYVYSTVDITLPTTGGFGTTMTYTIHTDAGSNATLTGNVLTLNAVEADATVVIEATLANGDTATDTSLFTFFLVGKTAAERVADDKADLIAEALDEDLYVGAERTLPTEGMAGSTITWAITTDADSMASLAGNVVTFQNALEAEATVVLTATIAYGLESDTVEVTYTLKAYPIVDLGDFADQTMGETVVVQGFVYAILQNGFFIEDETGKLFIYDSVHSYVLGDEVFLTGKVGEYKGSYQLTGLLEKPAPLSQGTDVEQTGIDYVHGTTELVAGETYTVMGEVAIEGQYNNVFIYIDETNAFEIYYQSPSASIDALEAMEGKEVIVDIIYYNDGSVFAFVGDAADIHEVVTVTDFSDIATLADDTIVKVTGIVTGNSYDGLFIQDMNGLGLFMFRPDETGINVGDKVVYLGELATYNSARQLGYGAELLEVVSTGNDLIVTSPTADEMDAFDTADAGALYAYDGFVFNGFTSFDEMELQFTLSDGTTIASIYLSEDEYLDWLSYVPDMYSVGDTLPEMYFHVYNFNYGKTYLDVAYMPVVDAAMDGFDTTLTNAIAYTYNDYTYNMNEQMVNGFIINNTYLESELLVYNSGDMYQGIMHDLARFLGAIYRATDSTVVALHYDGVEYTWNTAGTLAGSNWEDASGNTLVSVITADFVGGTITNSLTVTMEDANAYMQDLTLNFSVTMDQSGTPSTITELFISEYGEGGSNNKWVEIYNGTDSAIDLTPYSIELYSNGGTTASQTLDLTGTLAAGDVYVIMNSSTALTNVIAESDTTSSITFFNGDDALALLKDGVVIDVFGVIGEDPGSAWDVGTDTTANHTLVRKATVTGPTTTWDPNEWDAYDQDTETYVGSHTTN